MWWTLVTSPSLAPWLAILLTGGGVDWVMEWLRGEREGQVMWGYGGRGYSDDREGEGKVTLIGIAARERGRKVDLVSIE